MSTKDDSKPTSKKNSEVGDNMNRIRVTPVKAKVPVNIWAIPDSPRTDSSRDKRGHVGLANPHNNCYLNSIIQVLFACDTFRDDIIEHFTNKDTELAPHEHLEFVRALAYLMWAMKNKDDRESERAVKRLRADFPDTDSGDYVQKCFPQIVSKVNNVLRKRIPTLPKEWDDEAEKSHFRYQCLNNGFVFDSFYSQIGYTMKCESCDKVFNENYQLLNVFPVPIPSGQSAVYLEDCLDTLLAKSSVEGSDDDMKCCNNQNIVSISQLTHLPKYVFLYVVRGSYIPGQAKNNTNVILEAKLNVPTKYGHVLYKLKATAEHLGGNESGHYYAKCFNNRRWMLCNDTQVETISPGDVVSNKTVGFLMSRYRPVSIPSPHSHVASVIQMLFCCYDFRIQMFDYVENAPKMYYHENDKVKMAKSLGNLMKGLEDMDKSLVETNMEFIDGLLSKNGMELFDRISDILSILKDAKDSSGYICNVKDLFYMEIKEKYSCSNCGFNLRKPKTLISCIKICAKGDGSEIRLDQRICSYFGKNDDGTIKEDPECCWNPSISMKNQIERPSKYIFIYIDKEKCEEPIPFNDKAIFQNHTYYLKAVVCREGDKYITKCLHSHGWSSFDEDGSKDINYEDVYSPNAVAFLMTNAKSELMFHGSNVDYPYPKENECKKEVNIPKDENEFGMNVGLGDAKRDESGSQGDGEHSDIDNSNKSNVTNKCWVTNNEAPKVAMETDDDINLQASNYNETVIKDNNASSLDTWPASAAPSDHCEGTLGRDIETIASRDLKSVIDAIGSSISSEHKYLAPLIQALYSCKLFRDDIAKYEPDSKSSSNKTLFLANIRKLFLEVAAMDKREVTVDFKEFEEGNNISECYVNILSIIREEEAKQTSDKIKDDDTSGSSGNINDGKMICDLFGCKMKTNVKCPIDHTLNKPSDVINSIKLEIKSEEDTFNLRKYIEDYFLEKESDADEHKVANCSSGKVLTEMTLIDAPKYPMLYVVDKRQGGSPRYIDTSSKEGIVLGDTSYKINAIVESVNGIFSVTYISDGVGEHTRGPAISAGSEVVLLLGRD